MSRVRRVRSLQVLSVRTAEEKKIPSDCPIQFSTDPIYTQVGREGYMCKSAREGERRELGGKGVYREKRFLILML